MKKFHLERNMYYLMLILFFAIKSTASFAQCPNPTSIWLSAPQTSTTFPLQWTSASGAQSYDLRYCELPNTNADTTVIKGFSTTTTQTLIGLRQNVNHKLQIRSVCNGVPATTWFNAASNYLTGSSSASCSPLSSITTAVTGGNNIQVTWTGTGSFTVRYRASSSAEWIIPSIGAMNIANGSSGFTITGLANGTYTVGVKVNCTGQSSTYTTNTIIIGPSCSGTPATPAAVVPTAITTTSAIVTMPSTPSGLTYNLRYALVSNPTAYTFINGIASGAMQTLSPLLSNTAYNVQIQAQCNAATSGWSPVATFTTLANTNDPWREPHKNIALANQPATAAMQFQNLFGTNIGYGIQGIPTQYKGVVKQIRNFNLMENDYRAPTVIPPNQSTLEGNHFPNEGAPNPNLNGCTPNVFANQANCTELIIPGNGKNGFMSKDWYCRWRSNEGFDTTYAALESIFPGASGSCNTNTIFRGYPDKFYTPAEMGSSSVDRQNKIAAYVKNFVDTYCPADLSKPCLVNELELNEPWGPIAPSPAGHTDVVLGIIQGMKNAYNTPNATNGSGWRMKLGAGAFEAFTTNPGCTGNDVNQYIETMIPVSARPFLDFVSVHNYATGYQDVYNGGITSCFITKSPEADNGAFLTVKNMIRWRNEKMPHARVNITEFGWHDNEGPGSQVGSVGQNAYYMRALLLSHRYNINKTFLYTLKDSDEFTFLTTSFFKRLANGEIDYNSPRPAFLALKKVVDKPVSIKDKRFLKALNEVNTPAGYYAYLYGTASGQPTDLVVWRADEYTTQQNAFLTPSATATAITLPSGLSVNNGTAFYYLNHNATNDGSVTNNGTGFVFITGTNSATVSVKLSGMPLVIPLATNSCTYNASGTLTCGCSITNAGSFAGDQCNATSYNPALINMPAATGSPTISYLWEQSTNSGSTWTNAPTPNTAVTYDPTTITATTWYRRKASSSTCPANFQYSNVVKKQVGGCGATVDLSISFVSFCKMSSGNVKMLIKAENLGTTALSNITVNFNATLSTGYNPAGTVYTPGGSSTYTAGWTGGPNSTWTIPSLAAGANVTLLFEHYLSTTSPGVSVQATHSYPGDNVTGNNTATITTFPINNCSNPSGTAGRPARTSLTQATLNAYPNPFIHSVNIDIDIQKDEKAELMLISANGQVLFTNKYNLTKGLNRIHIDTKDIPSGLYTVKVSFDEADHVLTRILKIH